MFKTLKKVLLSILLFSGIFISACGAEKCEFCSHRYESIYKVNGKNICENCYYSNRVCHICGAYDSDTENKICLYITQRGGRQKTVCLNCRNKYDICPACFRLYSEADYYFNGRKLCYDCYRMFNIYPMSNDYRFGKSALPGEFKLNGVKLKLCFLIFNQ